MLFLLARVFQGSPELFMAAFIQENPKASFIVIEPGDSLMQWKGVRLNLEMDAYECYREMLDSFHEKIRKMAGDQSADALVAAIRFKITDVRPLIDPTA